MNTVCTLLTSLVSAGDLALSYASALGQNESQDNTTSSSTYDSTGRVTAIAAPLTITVGSRRGPFRYQLDPDVHAYAHGKPIAVREIRVGANVTVYYYKRLNQETVARVVVLDDPAKK